MAARQHLWRFLQDMDDEFSYNVTFVSSSSSSSSPSPSPSSSLENSNQDDFDATVFWGVIAFILVLLTAKCIWCWCFADKEALMQWFIVGTSAEGRLESDRHYQMTLRQRHEQRMAARRGTPEKRTARLKRSFVQNKVQMTVQEGDIVSGEKLDITGTNSSSSSCCGDEATGESPPDIESGTLNNPGHDDDDDDDDDDDLAGKGDENVADNVDLDPETTAKPTQPTLMNSSSPSKETLSNDETSLDMEAMEGGQAEVVTAEPAANCADSEAPFRPDVEESVPPMQLLATPNDLEPMSEQPNGQLVLRPGNAKHPPKNPRMVSSCCAVCLDEYQIDDIVVWSCNKDCKHAFHQECILEWLNKIQDGGTPCPCCRQEFTDWETMRQLRKIKWAADKAFDVNALRFT